ncbi:hypothetical protein ACFPVV_01655 [Macrococcoides bohemicum]|uniref:Uncharacterized protein n=1 Tax=Macrococcoides bohemicum TaxID=1903056 RepID=A0A328A6T6_9STAP|nr:hypothetical protein [Macrococcus bohemicus]RAK50189.1 hypothetical protein BHX94_01625 [Macrococcus bohemicus]
MNQNNIEHELLMLQEAKKILKYEIIIQFMYVIAISIAGSLIIHYYDSNIVKIVVAVILFIFIVWKAYRVTILKIAMENVDDEIKQII